MYASVLAIVALNGCLKSLPAGTPGDSALGPEQPGDTGDADTGEQGTDTADTADTAALDDTGNPCGSGTIYTPFDGAEVELKPGQAYEEEFSLQGDGVVCTATCDTDSTGMVWLSVWLGMPGSCGYSEYYLPADIQKGDNVAVCVEAVVPTDEMYGATCWLETSSGTMEAKFEVVP